MKLQSIPKGPAPAPDGVQPSQTCPAHSSAQAVQQPFTAASTTNQAANCPIPPVPGRVPAPPPPEPEPEPEPELPVIQIFGDDVSITDSATELFEALAVHDTFFICGGVLCRLVENSDTGLVEIKEVDAATACSAFDQYVRFARLKFGKQGKREIQYKVLSKAQAESYIKSDPCFKVLLRLRGVISCPLLIKLQNGLHTTKPGYDKETGFYVTTEDALPVIGWEEGKKRLNFLLQDFEFKTPGDKSRALASFLTPALKFGGFIQGHVPVEVAEADQSQAGKSFRQRLVAAVYHERMAVVTKKSGGVGNYEELLQQEMLNGRAFIQLDNVRGKLDSQFLESYLTAAGSVAVRVAYRAGGSIDPSKQVVFISSNGFEATKDLANRSSIVRINKRLGHNFALHNERNLVDHAYEDYLRYLAAVYALIRQWHFLGRKRTEETRHDFREWCQVCDWIVQNLFREAPLMDGHDEAKERSANPSLSFFRNLSVKLHQQGRLGQNLTASNIAEFCEDHDVIIPNLDDGAINDNNQRKIQVGKLLKTVLGDGEERVWEGYRIRRREGREQTDQGNAQTVKRYTITAEPGIIRPGRGDGGAEEGSDA